MTQAQKHALRLSEVRERLNTIGGLEGDDYSDEVKTEERALQTEYPELERRYRSALIAEGEAATAAAGQFGNVSGEDGERGRLLSEVRMADYLGPAAGGVGIVGRAAELNAALEVPTVGPGGGVLIPWAALELRGADGARIEERAFTTTAANDGPQVQRPILQRLFGPGVMDMLGVRMDSVPVGRTEWPLITGGVAPAQVKEPDAAAAAVTAAFSFANLKPKRLSGKYEFSHESAASVPGIEAALRRDLADAVKSAMSNQVINGVAPTNAAPQNVQGFLSKLGAADDLAAAEATAADYGKLHATGVDGVHASSENEVSGVIGTATYIHSAGVYIAGSGKSGSELLRLRSGGCMASSYIPDAAAMKQSALLHAAGPNGGGVMRGDSVCAVWPSMEVIRDIYSQASQGVSLTWVTLWDASVAFRSAAYAHVGIQIES